MNKKSEQIVSLNGYKFGMNNAIKKNSPPKKEASLNNDKSSRSLNNKIYNKPIQEHHKLMFISDGEKFKQKHDLKVGLKRQDFISSKLMSNNY